MRRIAFVLALFAAVATTACSTSPTAPSVRAFDANGTSVSADVIVTDTTKKSGFVLPQ